MDRTIADLSERIKELEHENEILRRKQVEIIEAKELYLKIFEEFPALIWRSRLDKLCDYFNKTWLEFTGRTMEQEFGNGWAEGVHPEDFDFCVQTYVEAFDKRSSFLMEYRMKNKFGEYRWIRDFGRPFYDLDNTFLGYIGSCYDITDNKIIEQELIELNATKDKFFSIIAHDLKAPFNAVVGFSELLLETIREGDFQKADEFAEIIRKSSNKALDLLMNLMTWAQSQSGRLTYNPEWFDPSLLLREVLLVLNATAKQKSIEIVDTLPPGIQVRADKMMVSTILRNLISNAIKFTQPGGRVRISASPEQHQIIFAVSDTGIGISKDRIESLFNIRDGFSTTGTQNETGTGLGLILCKEFIAINHGEIWVESQLGSGTTIYFSLPSEPADNPTQEVKPA